MQIHVCSRAAANSVVQNLEGTIAIISVTDPEEPIACENHDNVLRLQFHDLDVIWPQLNEVTYFSNEMADKIVEFVNANNNVDHMVVHCEAGICRSPAIAAAISEYLGIAHVFFRSHIPNTMVFSMLRTRFGFKRSIPI